jgi:hypothetical protein
VTDVTEFEEAELVDRLYQINGGLQRQLRDAKDRSARMVEATHQGAMDAFLSLGKMTPVPPPPKDRRRKPETALWMLTDWQGAKLTSSYNSTVMRERVLLFCSKAVRITQIQKRDHPVRDAVILFGGDMVEGLFQFPTQPFEVDATLFDQYVTVSRLCVDVVRRALAAYEKVTVVAEWGNHGRIGSKRDGVPRSDNFDRMVYHLAREILAGETRLTWADSPEDIQRVEVGNYRALLCHGDEIGRHGYSSPTTLVSWVVRQQSGAYPWDFLDCYMGHFHQNQEWALPGNGGRLFMTGSTESGNRYASVGMASAAIPSQRLHFIDPEKGRVTSQHCLWLADG